MTFIKSLIRHPWGFILLAIMLVGLAVLGGIKEYSPVPYWDMWNGELDFYLQSSNWSAWWRQHNEHRILLAKAFFWLDIKYFGGVGAFLIAVNYILLATIAMIFGALFFKYGKGDHNSKIKIIFCCALTAWLFSWAQKENLTWAFQSQFFLAQLLPLASFYYFSRAFSRAPLGADFLVSCLLGLLSSFTMASGLLALPFLCILALVAKQHRLRILILFSLTAISFICYFYGYVPNAGHGSPLKSLIHQPIEFITYVFKYLGSPFYHLASPYFQYFRDGEQIGRNLAVYSGAFLVLNFFYFFVTLCKKGSDSTSRYALVFFGLYIIATAAATAGGRLLFGTDQAFAARYATPALMAWADLFILYSPYILSGKSTNRFIAMGFCLFFAALFPLQLTALEVSGDDIFDRSLAALALSLGVPDRQEISKVFPAPEFAIMIHKKAKDEKITIFGKEPLISLPAKLGEYSTSISSTTCRGYIDKVDNLQESNFSKISGWVYDPLASNKTDPIIFLDGKEKIIGYGVTGKTRDDVSNFLGKSARKSGFSGYVLNGNFSGQIAVSRNSTFCTLIFN